MSSSSTTEIRPQASPPSPVGRLAALPCGRRSKYVVIGLWVVALAILAPLAQKLTGAQKNDTSAWVPGSAESTKVFNLSEQFGTSDEAPAVVVYQRDSGITATDLALAVRDVAHFKTVAHIATDHVVGPIKSQDGQALQVLVPIHMGDGGWNQLSDTVKQLKNGLAPRPDGLAFHVTGPAGYAAGFGEAFKGIDGTLLYSAAAVVIIILLFTYRSPVLWLLPLISAGLALTAAQGVIYLLAKGGLVVNAQSQGILTVLVFGAGTDYALLLVARYREELRRHADRHEAMAFALHRAGPAIFASGTTVVIGMLALLLAEMNSTRGLGPVAALGIAVGLLAMLTLLPALLVLVGRWFFWPTHPTFGSADHTETGLWARIGRGIARGPRLVWVLTAVVLIALAGGAIGLKHDGILNKDAFTKKVDAVLGDDVVSAHFPLGTGNPVIVIAKAQQQTAVVDQLQHLDGIKSTTPPVAKNGYVYVEATMSVAPDGKQAQRVIDEVRKTLHAIPGADAKVGGQTAFLLDTKRAIAHDNAVIIPVVLLIVFVVLMMLLRAVIAPIMLIGTVVVSFLAALGLSNWLFHAFGFKGADYSLPLICFVFLVALGIDYNIFLMSRVHEEAKQVGTRRGALIGLSATGGVITSAGLVLAGTFAVLATLPAVSFAEIGIVVAVGVLLDTMIVRSILVTALTLDIGRRLWWPSALAQADDDTLAELTSHQT